MTTQQSLSTTKPNNSSNKTNSNFPNLKDDRPTREEIRKIFQSIDHDKDQFDNIMEEYTKEISDPNNIAETNQYLREAEKKNDLPKNVKLAEPKKGFCIKSEKFSIKRPSMRCKAYINICALENVSPPKEDSNHMWSLPHLLNKGRNDQDNKGNLCMTFDVIFHPEAIRLAKGNLSFKKFVCDTSINGLNNSVLKASGEKISLDYVVNKYDYKGKEVALMNVHAISAGELDSRKEPNDSYKSQIQNEIEKIKNENEIEEDEEKVFDKPDVNLEDAHESIKNQNELNNNEMSYPITPKYKIKYSDDFQLQKYFYNPNPVVEMPQYNKLIVEIEVPLMDNLNLAEVELDSRKLFMRYKEIYILNIDFLVEVDKEKSEAKFDRKKNLLTVSALIVRKNKEELKLKQDENIEIINEDEENKKETVKIENQNIEKEKLKNQFDDNLPPDNLKEEKVENKIIPQEKNKNELLEFNNENKSQNDSIKLTNSLENYNNNDINKPLVEEKKQMVEEVKNENKEEIKKINQVDVYKEKYKDEDDVENNILNNSTAISTLNQHSSHETEKEKLVKISYINFNCDLIYEID